MQCDIDDLPYFLAQSHGDFNLGKGCEQEELLIPLIVNPQRPIQALLRQNVQRLPQAVCLVQVEEQGHRRLGGEMRLIPGQVDRYLATVPIFNLFEYFL